MGVWMILIKSQRNDMQQKSTLPGWHLKHSNRQEFIHAAYSI
jgi:hypothetical protein